MSGFIQWPAASSGSGSGIQAYANFAALPAGQADGTVAIVLDTYILYAYESGAVAWVEVGGPGAAISLAAFGSTPNANGLSLSAGGGLNMQPADGTHPGGVSILAQTFAGAKTFSTAPILSSLSASLPLQLDGSKNITAAAVDLSGAQATGILAAGRFPALTGDITTSAGALGTTLATVNANVGSFGSSTAIPNFTVNGKGLITAAGSSAVVAPAGTLTGTTLAANVVTSSLTAVGILGTGTWQADAVAATYGGTGLDTHASTGYPSISAGTWSVAGVSATFSTLFKTVATTLGDLVYGGASGAPSRLAGDTTNAKKFLTSTSSAGVAAAPAWAAIVAGDLPTIALTGDVTGSASGGSIATTVAKIAGTTVSGTTGTTNVAFSASPTFTGTITAAAITASGQIQLGGLSASQAVVTDGSKNLVSLAYATTATGTTLAERDANANLTAANHIEGYTTTATATATTTLTVSSNFQQYFTGTQIQTCQMPVVSGLVTGQAWQITNLSTGVVTVNSSGGNQIIALPSNTAALVTCISTAGTGAASWSAQYTQIVAGTPNSPTIQKFTSGSGTYTTPTNPAPLYIKVRMVGGGGGGGGSGTTTGTAGTSGGNTTFGSSLLTANGGTVGTNASGTGPAGGSATISAPAIGTALTGASGQGSGTQRTVSTASPTMMGSMGGSSPFGGAGSGAGYTTLVGGAAQANTGSGGGGGGSSASTNNTLAGTGGGAGGYIEAIIANPSATYAYAVGTGGNAEAAGTSGFAGGAGGSGYIEVTEYYPAYNTGAGNFTVDTFSGNGSTTAFTLTAAPATVNNCDVYISGVYQNKAGYTIAGTTLTFATAPPSGTNNIQVNTGLAVALNVPADASITAAKFASGTGATVTQANPGVVLSAGQLLGTNTNDNASAGNVGEYFEVLQSVATNCPTADQYTDLGASSITLTAGDWEISAVAEFTRNSGTWTGARLGISTTTGNSGTGLTFGVNAVRLYAQASASMPDILALSIPSFRVSLSGSTTYYGKILATYSGGTPQYSARLSARRVR